MTDERGTGSARGRGRRSFLRRPVGWIVLVSLALGLVVLAAPSVASRLAPGWVEEAFARDRAGRLEIGEVDLGWFGRQRVTGVRLIDPDGGLVAEVDLDLPSLGALALGRGHRIGRVVVDARADLVADDGGVSNLERALALRADVETPDGESPDGEEGSGLELPEAEVLVRVAHLSWSDVLTRRSGAPFRLEDLELRARSVPGEPVSLTVDGVVRSDTASGLHVDARVFDLDAGPERPVRLELEAEIEDLPTALVDALAGQGGTLVELLGPSVTLGARGTGSTEAGHVELALTGERASARLSADLEQGMLRIEETAPLELSAHLPAELVARLTADRLPPDVELRSVATRGPLRLTVKRLALPVDSIRAAETDAARARALAGTGAELQLELEDLGVTLSGEPIDLEGTSLTVILTPDAPARAGFSARVSAHGLSGGAGQLDWRLTVAEPFAGLAGDPAPAPAVHVQGEIRSLDTALVDRLAEQDGLLLDALGERLDLTLDATWPDDPERPLRAVLSSERASVEFEGQFQDGVLVASGGQGLDAQLPLSPLVSARLVGKLVPVLVDLAKPEQASGVGLFVSDLRLPLDGDLGQLSATVRLELGEVGYQLLPGLRDTWAGFQREPQRLRTTTLDPFVVRVADGVVSYDPLPLRIDGRVFPLRGSFDLGTRTFDLATTLPLGQLGGEVEKALDKARAFLDPELQVPIRIRGTWDRPQVSVDPGFVQTVVENAAQGALRKGLGDLFRK